MSDAGRKGFAEQAQEKLTPQSQKSTGDKIGENASGMGDRIAGAVQPEGNKSTGQKMGDTMKSGSDDASNQGKGIMDSVTDTFNSVTGQKK